MMPFGKAAVILMALASAAFGQVQLWPKPQTQSDSGVAYTVNSSRFSFASVGASSDVLSEALQRYTALCFYPGPGLQQYAEIRRRKVLLDELEGLDVNVTTPDLELDLDTDESYQLTVASPRAALVAATAYGALRGLESFSQLIDHVAGSTYTVNGTQLVDFPRFRHRGVMIDTARHWLPLPTIFQHLDAMSYNKFNVLHWHLVDDQAFPFVSRTFPLLSEEGAWTADEVYSPQDVQAVIDYARLRGIRVVPEFDTPGHTLSWGAGYPFLLTPCYNDNGQPSNTFGPMFAISNKTYDFLMSFFSEIDSVFPDQYVHLGGDEVSFDCWQSNPDVQAWMKARNWTDYAMLENYYEDNLLGIMNQLNKSYVVWEEIFVNGLHIRPDTVVHVWRSGWTETIANVTLAGFRAVLSSPWYLNKISYGEDWPTYYLTEPTNFTGTPEQFALIMGGEACLWAEWIDDTNLVSRAWPRASAVGERLWSSRNVNNLTDASLRINTHRCRMVRRNIPAEPITGPGYCPQEFVASYNPPWYP